MLSKGEWISSLLKLGFVKDSASRTDGSHMRFYHSEYPNLFVGVDDHKNTKEMSLKIHKELLQSVTMLVWIQSSQEDGGVDVEKAKEITKKLPKELKAEIIKKLKDFEKDKMNLLLKIIPKRLFNEVDKISSQVTEQNIINYF